MDSILEVSTRTTRKIIERANKNICMICGWGKASCDIHHIVELSNGGTNHLKNLVIICPNCHRCVHELEDKFISKEELRSKSLFYTFPNWKDYYKDSIKRKAIQEKRSKGERNFCKNCGKEISFSKKFCSKRCVTFSRSKIKTKDELISILKKYKGNLTKSGREFDITGNGMKKQCQKFNVDYKQFRKTLE